MNKAKWEKKRAGNNLLGIRQVVRYGSHTRPRIDFATFYWRYAQPEKQALAYFNFLRLYPDSDGESKSSDTPLSSPQTPITTQCASVFSPVYVDNVCANGRQRNQTDVKTTPHRDTLNATSPTVTSSYKDFSRCDSVNSTSALTDQLHHHDRNHLTCSVPPTQNIHSGISSRNTAPPSARHHVANWSAAESRRHSNTTRDIADTDPKVDDSKSSRALAKSEDGKHTRRGQNLSKNDPLVWNLTDLTRESSIDTSTILTARCSNEESTELYGEISDFKSIGALAPALAPDYKVRATDRCNLETIPENRRLLTRSSSTEHRKRPIQNRHLLKSVSVDIPSRSGKEFNVVGRGVLDRSIDKTERNTSTEVHSPTSGVENDSPSSSGPPSSPGPSTTSTSSAGYTGSDTCSDFSPERTPTATRPGPCLLRSRSVEVGPGETSLWVAPVALPVRGDKVALPVRGDKAALPVRGDKVALTVRGDKVALPVRGDKVASPVREDKVAVPFPGEKVVIPSRGDKVKIPVRGDQKGNKTKLPRQRTLPSTTAAEKNVLNLSRKRITFDTPTSSALSDDELFEALDKAIDIHYVKVKSSCQDGDKISIDLSRQSKKKYESVADGETRL